MEDSLFPLVHTGKFCKYCHKELMQREFSIGGMKTLINIPCSCKASMEAKKKAAEAEQKAKFIEERKEQIAKYNMDYPIGLRMKNKSLDDFQVKTGNELAYKTAKNYVENFSKYKDKGVGLYIYGAAGSGKTHLAIGIKKALEKEYVPSIFVNATTLLAELEENRFSYDSPSVASVLSKLSTVPLLFIDDLGANRWSVTTTEYFYNIVDRRYSNLLPTIFTANQTLEDLTKAMGNRLGDRIAGSCIAVLDNSISNRVTELAHTFGK